MRILYIDDEQDLLEIAVVFFSEEGLPLDTCASFPAAWELVKQVPYDLIITDASMPSGSGVELVNQLRRAGIFKGKAMLVTGDRSHLDENYSHLFDRIYLKPIKFEDLILKVKDLI
jgi:CheY-like chemotaxis protein